MSTGRADKAFLVADIGGTHARFALADAATGRLGEAHELPTSDYPDIKSAITQYFTLVQGAAPRRAALAIANPVTGDVVQMTNNHWRFSIAALKQELDLDELRVLNDFEALALSVPLLGPGDCARIGAGEAVAGAPCALIGPGTGLGMGGLVYDETTPLPLASEGGHTTAVAVTDRENAVLGVLRKRFDHLSNERLLSGPGLVNIHSALAELEGRAVPTMTPAAISEGARADRASPEHEAVMMFCALLGTVAGDLALTLAARGGVYIGGGVVPHMLDLFEHSAFRERFEAKGRMRPLLASIPTSVIIATDAALRGDWIALRGARA